MADFVRLEKTVDGLFEVTYTESKRQKVSELLNALKMEVAEQIQSSLSNTTIRDFERPELEMYFQDVVSQVIAERVFSFLIRKNLISSEVV